MVGQLYLCKRYEGQDEPDVRTISVEFFIHLYNNNELPEPEDMIVTCSEEDMSMALYGEEGVPLDARPLNGEKV